MILNHHAFQLSGKPTFERVVGYPPLRLPVRMPNEACFYYIVEGDSRTYGPEGLLEQHALEGLVLQCGNYVTEFVTSTSKQFEAIAIHLYPEILRMIYDKDFPDFLEEVDRVRPIRYERYKSSKLLATYIKSLEFYFENPELVSDELQKLKIKELLLLLARTDKAAAVRNLINGLFNSSAPEFKSIIEANLYNNLSNEELALLTRMSLSGFKRTFRQKYQCPPARYIRQRRLEQAAKLLRRTELRISDVAYDCGFQDLANFSKTFNREYGVSPSQWRSSLNS